MNNNFARLKRKAWIVSSLLSVLSGIGIGVTVLSGFMLAMKLSARPVEALHYILAACAAAAAIAVFLLLFVPSAKRLAKRLDEEHGLNEKARTMLALEGSEDDFASLQREDADEQIGKIKFQPFRKKQVIAMILAVVIAVASLITALLVPAKTADGIEPEQPISAFDKEKILSDLFDMITMVENSLMADTLKGSELTTLRSLYDFVAENDLLSVMKIEAIDAVLEIDAALDEENTAPAIGAQLLACENQSLRDIGAELSALSEIGTQSKIGALKDALVGKTVAEISVITDELFAAVDIFGATHPSPLVSLLRNLVYALRGCADSNSTTIEAAFGTIRTDAMNEVVIQKMNKRVTETVISRLCTLFGISVTDLVEAGADEDITTDLPEDRPTDEEEDEGEDFENDQIGSGGIGTGDRIYGSNDMIYNPYTNDYVPYGQVFDEYNNKVLQMAEDGRIPPDFETFIKEYFRSLSEYNPEADGTD